MEIIDLWPGGWGRMKGVILLCNEHVPQLVLDGGQTGRGIDPGDGSQNGRWWLLPRS